MRCPECGRDNPCTARFCTFCGAELAGEGAESPTGWNFIPFYTRVSLVGLIVFAVIVTSLAVLAMAWNGVDWGVIEGAIFYAIGIIPIVVAVVMAWRQPGQSPILAPLWATVLLLVIVPPTVIAMGVFNSFFDAGLMIPAVASLLVAAVAGYAELWRRRRGSERSVSTAGERIALWATAVVVLGLMALSGVLHVNGIESVSASDRAGAITIDVNKSEFEPDQVTIPVGTPAKFVIRNRDLTMHSFTIEELGIDVDVLPGSEALVELSSLPEGTYEYVCEYATGTTQFLHKNELEDDPGGPSDIGTLVVTAP